MRARLGFVAALALFSTALPALAQDEEDPVDEPAEEPVTVEVDPSEPGSPEPVPFEPAAALQDRVSVTTKVTQTTQRTPASVSVITAQQIADAGYQSVGEALADVPGLYVGYDLESHNVAVRGLSGGARASSRFLKIMIDGRPVAFEHSGTYFLGPEFIPIGVVERIEVMRGPASSLYGAGALVGAINVVTKRAAYEGETSTESRISLRGGGLGVAGGGFEAAQTVVGRSWYALLAVSGARDDRSGLEVPGRFASRFVDGNGLPLRSESDLAKPLSLLARVEHVGRGGRLSATVIGQLHDYVAEFHDLTVMSHATRVRLYNLVAGVTWERPFASGWSLLLSGGATQGGAADGDRFDLGSDQAFVLERSFGYLQVRGAAEVRLDLRNGGWLLFGVDASHDQEELQRYYEVDRDSEIVSPRERPPSERLANGAGYAQVLYLLQPWLGVAGGLRFDAHSVYGPAWSGRAGLVAPLTRQLTLKLLAGRSYKAPSPEQLFGVPMDDLDVKGSETIAPQYLNGLEGIVDLFVGRGLNVNAGVFYNAYQDTLAYVSEGGQLRPVSFDASSYGGELVVRSVHSWPGYSLELTGSASAQRLLTAQRRLPGGLYQKDVPDDEAVPTTMGSARAVLRLHRTGLTITARYRQAGERVPSQSNLLADGTANMLSPSYTLPAFRLLDVTLSTAAFSIGDGRTFRAQMGASNLLDERYAEPGFNGADVPGLGRTIWARVEVAL